MPFTPHDAATHAIDRARALLHASRSPAKELSSSVRADMRRLSTVMAVAALDTYMHRLIVDRAYTHEKMPRSLAKLDLPFERLLAQADETKAAARKKPHKPRPRVAVKRQLRDRLLLLTFQRFEDVGTAIAMAGRGRPWDSIGQALDPAMTPDEIRTRLNGIVTRRNQIVHEGDYRRLERPRNEGRNSITRREASTDIDFLAALIDAIHAVV